jgi:hypothetical protein
MRFEKGAVTDEIPKRLLHLESYWRKIANDVITSLHFEISALHI